MSKLVIIRHGKSEWNKQNRFTGWVNVPLAPEGEEEARNAGKLLKERGFSFTRAFTSALERAQETCKIVLHELGQANIPYQEHEALNERMYGDLQGKNKAETAEKFGKEQVHIWRRSWDTPPPNGESLKGTYERVLPYFEAEILPKLRAGEDILVAAHGNSLRALVKFLEGISEEEIPKVEIPTGQPKVYQLDETGKVEKAFYLSEEG